eukprot:g4445.t1
MAAHVPPLEVDYIRRPNHQTAIVGVFTDDPAAGGLFPNAAGGVAMGPLLYHEGGAVWRITGNVMKLVRDAAGSITGARRLTILVFPVAVTDAVVTEARFGLAAADLAACIKFTEATVALTDAHPGFADAIAAATAKGAQVEAAIAEKASAMARCALLEAQNDPAFVDLTRSPDPAPAILDAAAEAVAALLDTQRSARSSLDGFYAAQLALQALPGHQQSGSAAEQAMVDALEAAQEAHHVGDSILDTLPK